MIAEKRGSLLDAYLYAYPPNRPTNTNHAAEMVIRRLHQTAGVLQQRLELFRAGAAATLGNLGIPAAAPTYLSEQRLQQLAGIQPALRGAGGYQG